MALPLFGFFLMDFGLRLEASLSDLGTIQEAGATNDFPTRGGGNFQHLVAPDEFGHPDSSRNDGGAPCCPHFSPLLWGSTTIVGGLPAICRLKERSHFYTHLLKNDKPSTSSAENNHLVSA